MMRHKLFRLKLNEQGFLMPALLSFIIAMGILSGAVLEVVLNNFTTVGNTVTSQKAFNIAEAGVNYYLWHLSHNATDFKDGQSTPASPVAGLGYGPYVHNYVDSNAVNEGTYTLYINPQGSGSTVATVRAIGKVKGSNISRTVQAQIGAPSFASYAVVSDSALWFGATESADGPVHSNQGIRMDGASNAEISSANNTYVAPANLGGNGSSSYPGVWCSSTVTAPVNCSTRSKSNWVYPVSSVDFNQVSSSLCTMKKVALNTTAANACSTAPTTRTSSYIPELSSTAFSATKGYLIRLNSNNTYDLYKVNGEDDTQASYTAALGITNATCNTPTWVACGVAIPSAGVIFVEDNAWVIGNGSIDSRVTIASGRLATGNNTDIVISGPLQYKYKNGADAIGLVAGGSVYIAPYAPPSTSTSNFTYEVDAAVLAETGSVTYGEAVDRYNDSVYRNNTNRCTRGWTGASQKMLFYGSVATRQTWTWTWQGGGSCGDNARDPASGYYISGILNNTTQYDYNLQYSPPPSYPVTNGYNILSWREVLTKP